MSHTNRSSTTDRIGGKSQTRCVWKEKTAFRKEAVTGGREAGLGADTRAAAGLAAWLAVTKAEVAAEAMAKEAGGWRKRAVGETEAGALLVAAGEAATGIDLLKGAVKAETVGKALAGRAQAEA